ncbi:hypothetical protein ACFE04_018889 [Oxalis oulophora]
MESTRSRKKTASSLNDRHFRFLHDLSANPKQHQSSSSSSSSSPRMDEKGRSSNDVVFGAPQFSGIADFDTPSPLPPPEKEKSIQNLTLLPTAADSHHPSGEDKPPKVKIAGRRRLCKLSIEDDTDANNKTVLADEDLADFDSPSPVKNEGRNEVTDIPNDFADIEDFNSPSPVKAVKDEGGNEIMDILNDLSSRLEIMSIDRNRAPKRVDPVPNFSALVKHVETGNKNKVNMPEYASVGSSFSISPEVSRRSSSHGTQNVQERMHDVSDEDENDVVTLSCEPKRENMQRPLAPRGILILSDDEEEENKIMQRQHKPKKHVDVEQKAKKTSYTLNKDETKNMPQVDFTLDGPKSTYKLPDKIAKMLYPHQCEGLKWLWSLHCQGKGGILGDDMGLGKTMQICGFLAGLYHSRLVKRVMIVAPKTLLPHWLKELSVVGLSKKTREYFGTCAKARQYELNYVLQDIGILLTTYDIVRCNSKSLKGGDHFDWEDDEDTPIWDYMILDENKCVSENFLIQSCFCYQGHLIKNPSTQRAKSLLEIPCASRIIISGTPIQNNLKELWALFHFCCPDLLGDKKWFKEAYENPILRGSDKKASDRDKRVSSTVAKELRDRIQPYFLRRLKSEVFDEDDATKTAKLSKKNEMIVWLRLTDCQRKIYEAYLKSEIVLSAFDGSPLAALTIAFFPTFLYFLTLQIDDGISFGHYYAILKKICDHPLILTRRAAEDVLEGLESDLNPEDLSVAEKLTKHLADVTGSDDFLEKHDVSCKMTFILSLLKKLIPDGHNVLIFSQTRKMLNLIQESLSSEGYEFQRIDGSTKAFDRLRIVNEFQEGRGAPIFLLTSQVGGLGITLTKADRVIVVDPAWNPSTDNQSVDRAYRIGQTKDVIVYRLMTCGTVEEKIYRKQIFKGGLFKTATDNKEHVRYFCQQDLKEIFSLPAQGFDISPTQQQLQEEHDAQDEYLEAHVKFLESLGIAGVSHHSLLFSKTAPVQIMAEEVEEISRRNTAYMVNPGPVRNTERDVDGAAYAFKPKDVPHKKMDHSPLSEGKQSESDIKAKISRLSMILVNKDTVSRLPDKGAKIQEHIVELNSQLQKLKVQKKAAEKEVIDLDNLTGKFQSFMNV